jgi:phage gpG-like protein
VEGSSITFSSSLPYASIHNEGGTIKVTTAMKKYFWAMYYQASGAITTTSTGKASKSKKNTLLTAEAAYWKSLALIKVGSKLTIKKRQFMGSHPTVDAAVEAIVNRHVNALAQSLAKTLQNKAFK